MKKLVTLEGHTCPWWFIYTFDNPLRRIFQNPRKILGEFIQPGDTSADIGCGMGYFTLEMAHLVGETGQVYAYDLQPEMLAGLTRRAMRRGLMERITPVQASSKQLGLEKTLNFALAFWMVHEVANKAGFFAEISQSLSPGGTLLMVEPRIHVPAEDFHRSVQLAQESGLERVTTVPVAFSRGVLLAKPSDTA